MAVRFQRHLGSVSTLSPGQFTTEPLRHSPGRMIAVTLACPTCGGIVEISKTHVVARDGRVTPAVECPFTCSFYDWVELDSYGEPQWDTSDVERSR